MSSDFYSRPDIPKYLIGIMVLENIENLSTEYIEIETFDLSITQITIYPREVLSQEGNNGLFGRFKKKEVKKTTPTVVFNLYEAGTFQTRKFEKGDSEEEEEKDIIKRESLRKVSLIECMLPNQQILASKCILNKKESIITEIIEEEVKKKFYETLVYDLFVFTRRSLFETNQTYEQYTKEINKLNESKKREIDNLRREYEERRENAIEPYIKTERELRNKITELQDRINEFIMRRPEELSKKFEEFALRYGGE